MKKTIVISAINFRSGGPLSILNDCLKYLDDHLGLEYHIIALVHKKSIVTKTNNIEYIEFPDSIKSYLYRLYYEYIYFKKLSKKLNPYLWFSLHDVSPVVYTEIQAVYCHNPSPFYKINASEFFLDKKFAFFSWFYKYLYKINIHSNDFVVVQQEWLRNKFKDIYKVKNCVVSYPIINVDTTKYVTKQVNEKIIFFYPSFPRIFKNFEIICEAVKKINQKFIDNFEIILTINGTENDYAKSIYNKYKDVKNIKFIGLQSREKVFELYSLSDCLIFPSKLETWGLPISEFKQFNKPMLLADLEYSHETVGQYDQVAFFHPEDSAQLSKYIEGFIEHNLVFENHTRNLPEYPFARTWGELFTILLQGVKSD